MADPSLLQPTRFSTSEMFNQGIWLTMRNPELNYLKSGDYMKSYQKAETDRLDIHDLSSARTFDE